MPGYKGHLGGGLVAYAIMLSVASTLVRPTPLVVVEWAAFCFAGSLFPDVDTNSHGQKLFARIGLVMFAALLLKKQFELIAYFSPLLLLPMLVKHRGIFHRLWFIFGFPALLAYLAIQHVPKYQMAILLDTAFFCAGALSHLWLDYGFRRMFRW